MQNILKRLTDPFFLEQYRTLQDNRPYGRSGLQFLPETTLYFLACVADGRIDLQKRAPRIVDYGCGNSLMLDALCHILDKHMHTLQIMQQNGADVTKLYIPLMPDITHYLDEDTIITPYEGRLVKPVKYDPAIAKFSRFPRGRIDFVTCTDVLEHIPVHSKSNASFPLNNTIKTLSHLSPNVFLNISTRLAAQVLPNGTNAHCTVQSPAQWQALLQHLNHDNLPITPVLSRDTTSCSFFYGTQNSTLKYLQYLLLERFGPIDLIPFPPTPDMPAEKMGRLKHLQPHKIFTQSRYIDYWLKTDSLCWNNAAFRTMAAAQMRTRRRNPQQQRHKLS